MSKSRLFGADVPGPERRRARLELFARLGRLDHAEAVELAELRLLERDQLAERCARMRFSASGTITTREDGSA